MKSTKVSVKWCSSVLGRIWDVEGGDTITASKLKIAKVQLSSFITGHKYVYPKEVVEATAGLFAAAPYMFAKISDVIREIENAMAASPDPRFRKRQLQSILKDLKQAVFAAEQGGWPYEK